MLFRSAAEPFASQLETNLPGIYSNGGAVLGLDGEFVYQLALPESAKRYCKQIIQDHPHIQAIAIVHGDYYVLSGDLHGGITEFEVIEIKPAKAETWDQVWAKVLFVLDPDQVPELEHYCCEMDAPDVDFVRGLKTLLEMLPTGTNKLVGLQRMIEHTGLQDKTVVFIGDYYNDLELVKYAHIGAAPANAVDAVKAAADLIVPDCTSGAVEYLIDYLGKQ